MSAPSFSRRSAPLSGMLFLLFLLVASPGQAASTSGTDHPRAKSQTFGYTIDALVIDTVNHTLTVTAELPIYQAGTPVEAYEADVIFWWIGAAEDPVEYCDAAEVNPSLGAPASPGGKLTGWTANDFDDPATDVVLSADVRSYTNGFFFRVIGCNFHTAGNWEAVGLYEVQPPPPPVINHVTTRAFRKPLDAAPANPDLTQQRTSHAFADALGRAIQTVTEAATPTQQDLVQPIAYDAAGFQTQQYLAYPVTPGPFSPYREDALDEQDAFWQQPPADVVANPTPYAKTIHRNSPLRQTQEAGAAAPAWQPEAAEKHTVRTIQRTNRNDFSNQAYEVLIRTVEEERGVCLQWDQDTCVLWNSWYAPHVDKKGGPTGGSYPSGTLYKMVTIDPNGDSTAVFTDTEGREILKVAYLEGGRPVKTYYVYDGLGQLRFIVPPLATEALGDTTHWDSQWGATDADSLFHTRYFTEYRYDAYGRQIEKKLPEEEVVTTVYDRLGRAVLQQDGVFRPDSLWYFTKYDAYGRVILTGTWTDALGRDRAQMQAHVDTTITGTKDAGAGTYAYFEQRDANTEHGYTEDAAFPPLAESTVWTVSYFDDYDFSFNSGSPQFVQDYAATGSDAGQHYISPFAATDRVLDQATGGKVLLPGAPGVYEQSHYGAGFVPAEPDTVYLLNAPSGGTITLGPGFSTNNGQHVEVGPVTPEGTAQTAVYLETVTYYDRWGRAIQSQSTNHLGGVDRTSTQYSHDGLALQAKTVHQTPHDTVTVSSRSEYDHAGRLLRTYQQHDSQAEVLVAQLHYNALGEVTQKDLHSENGGTSFTQSVHYEYHVRGWLTEVDIPGLWRFRLSYDTAPGDDGYGAMGFTPRYDGSVTAQTWRTDFGAGGSGFEESYGYTYHYDGLGRLAKGQFGERHFYVPGSEGSWHWEAQDRYTVDGLAYDRNGNIERLRRRDDQGVAVDDLTYSYDTNAPNRLLSVSDVSNDTTAMYFRAASTCSFGSQYAYDGNGSMVVDPHKCVQIAYNYKNLPVLVEWEDGRRIEWTYDATGAKLRKRVLDAVGSVVSQLDYVGGFVYRSGGGTSPRLAFYGQPEGRVVVDEQGAAFFEYVISDHLGNSRVVFDEGGGVVQEDHYYPFGLKLAGLVSSSTSEPHQYTYNGKELEDDHDLWWYHYGVRYYDPQVARWMAIDPADEFFTPYAYVGNDPINLVDPDGAQSETNTATQPWTTEPEKITTAAENAVEHVKCIDATNAYCNVGVRVAFKQLSGSDDLKDLTANQISYTLGTSDSWEEIDLDDVQDSANNGEIVVGTYMNPSWDPQTQWDNSAGGGKSGHVVLAVPHSGENPNTVWDGRRTKAPMVMDTGRNMRSTSQGANQSFGRTKRGSVHWYRYVVPAVPSSQAVTDSSSTANSNPQRYRSGQLMQLLRALTIRARARRN